MAPSPLTSSQEQLLQSLLPKTITTGKSRRYRDAFNRRVKHHNHGRTNQFEVSERLDGLEEKFQILNRDDLSDALRSRRAELQKYESERRFLPDLLDLLLRLSVDPANIKRSDRQIEVKKEPTQLPTLRWVDIGKDDPIDRDDPIWENPDYSDLSSDEDVFRTSSPPSSPNSLETSQRNANQEVANSVDMVFEDQSLTKVADLSIYRDLGADKNGKTVLTECEATGECLFMLQGLPTRLFSGNGTRYEANTHYSLKDVSHEVFSKTLRSFGQIGKRVGFVRGWLAKSRSTQYTRILRDSIRKSISFFDTGISQVQGRMLRPSGPVHVGLLPCLEAATRYYEKMQILWTYLHICETKQSDSIGQLEVLFDLICSKQAVGEVSEALTLTEVFMPTFQAYMKPLLHWLKHGELHDKLEGFFVTPGEPPKDLTHLWDGWFMLDETANNRRAPGFLRQFSQTIFALGKTTLFLRRLEVQHRDVVLESLSMSQLDDLPTVLVSNYLSFAEVFVEAFESTLSPALTQTSNLLYQELDQQCGLWNTLNAFELIYFAKQGPITDNIDATLFRRLDRCHTSWSDRFVLLDLYENAFADIAELDIDRLIIHSSHTSSRSIESRRKSVKILGDLSVNYRLPWQIANIIPQTCFASYRRISLLLMQLRRARYCLERRAHFAVMNASLDSDVTEQAVSRALYRKLLLFQNILYNHLTALVIDSSTSQMKTHMRQASTVDEMTTVHTSYITNLEKACLTSKRLTPIRDTVISILDLSVRFTDIVTTPPGGVPTNDDDDARSFRSAASRLRQKKRRRQQQQQQQQQQQDDQDFEDEDEDEDDEEVSSADEGYSTFVVLEEDVNRTEEFKRMGRDFERYLAFIAAGLRSLGRVDGEESWEILAGRLDWKQRAEY